MCRPEAISGASILRVIQELGLDAQQADQFFDLLADQQLRANDQMQPLWDMEGLGQ